MARALYIHWPFCARKCPYCDFNSHVRESVDQAAWRDALLADMAHEAALTQGARVSSIFFGGGTPSLMPPETVAALIAAGRARAGAEVRVGMATEASGGPAVLFAPTDPVQVGAANRALARAGIPWRLGARQEGDAPIVARAGDAALTGTRARRWHAPRRTRRARRRRSARPSRG